MKFNVFIKGIYHFIRIENLGIFEGKLVEVSFVIFNTSGKSFTNRAASLAASIAVVVDCLFVSLLIPVEFRNGDGCNNFSSFAFYSLIL